MPKGKTAPLTDEERERNRERQRLYQKKYLAKKAAQKSLLPPPEEHDLVTEKADPSILAAWINERYNFSEVLGEYHRGGKTIIAERLNKSDIYSPNYRLKTTQYVFFTSRAALEEYVEKNKIKLKYN